MKREKVFVCTPYFTDSRCGGTILYKSDMLHAGMILSKGSVKDRKPFIFYGNEIDEAKSKFIVVSQMLTAIRAIENIGKFPYGFSELLMSGDLYEISEDCWEEGIHDKYFKIITKSHFRSEWGNIPSVLIEAI